MSATAAETIGTRAARTAEGVLRKPLLAILVLLAIAGLVEVLQYLPEQWTGGHAVGELFKNLAYALVGALLFHWLVVQIPGNQRKRKTYEFHRQHFEVLCGSALGLLHQYQAASDALVRVGAVPKPVDVWDQDSLRALAPVAATAVPGFFGPDRAKLLSVAVDVAIPRVLSDLAVAVPYLDAEVAHSLSLFPRQDGIRVLQVDPLPDGSVEPLRDVHIVWSLLEATRDLYEALLSTGAFSRDLIQAQVVSSDGTTTTNLTDSPILRGSDLTASSHA